MQALHTKLRSLYIQYQYHAFIQKIHLDTYWIHCVNKRKQLLRRYLVCHHHQNNVDSVMRSMIEPLPERRKKPIRTTSNKKQGLRKQLLVSKVGKLEKKVRFERDQFVGLDLM